MAKFDFNSPPDSQCIIINIILVLLCFTSSSSCQADFSADESDSATHGGSSDTYFQPNGPSMEATSPLVDPLGDDSQAGQPAEASQRPNQGTANCMAYSGVIGSGEYTAEQPVQWTHFNPQAASQVTPLMSINIPKPVVPPQRNHANNNNTDTQLRRETINVRRPGQRDMLIDVWRLPQPTGYDSKRFYVPEHDDRWSFRAKALEQGKLQCRPINTRHETYMEFNGPYPVKVIKGKPYGVMFYGEPRDIELNGKHWTVPMGMARVCFGGKFLLAFGGPGHEVIINDQWYNIPFDEQERTVWISDGRTLNVRLSGNLPPVKTLGEVKTPAEVARMQNSRLSISATRAARLSAQDDPMTSSSTRKSSSADRCRHSSPRHHSRDRVDCACSGCPHHSSRTSRHSHTLGHRSSSRDRRTSHHPHDDQRSKGKVSRDQRHRTDAVRRAARALSVFWRPAYKKHCKV